MKRILFAPSLLSANFLDLRGALGRIARAGAERIHYDVMDGNFVPPISYGEKILADIAPAAPAPIDVHLMTLDPGARFEAFRAAGAASLTFHVEAAGEPLPLLAQVRGMGLKAGISLKPGTEIASIESFLDALDIVLVMTVEPGYGGQRMLPACVRKVAALAELKIRRGLAFEIQVDGGVNAETAAELRAAGADLLVAGSAFFTSGAPERFAARLRGEA